VIHQHILGFFKIKHFLGEYFSKGKKYTHIKTYNENTRNVKDQKVAKNKYYKNKTPKQRSHQTKIKL